jgi:hypothetical protein
MLHTALAVAAALVAVAFSLSTFERWLAARRPQEAAWTAALVMFAVAAGALAAGAELGWSGPVFRTFYLFGAVLNVPWLALGTIYLLAPPARARRAAAVVGLLSAFAAGCLLVAPFTAALPKQQLAQGSDVFGTLPRILAAVSSGGGALVVLGGAVWSATRARARRLVASNSLLAVGTLVLGGSGLLNSVLDAMDAFSVTLVIGITLLFAGFLTAAGGEAPSPSSRAAPRR